MNETRVGTRELKSKLSEYLRLVKAGQTVIITERGKVIAHIAPSAPTLEERMEALVKAGLAEWDGQKVKPYRPSAVNRGDRQVSDLVVEDRQ
jgi:prevent-host-death family protein